MGVSSPADVLTVLDQQRVLPVVTVEDPETALGVATALSRAGMRCIEVTLRTPGALAAIEEFAASGSDMIVGAGTVLSVEAARAASDAGAGFALSPVLREDVVKACDSLGIAFFPGVATPTEVERARALGVRAMKVFPAQTLGGVSFLRAVAAVFPDVRFIPTGGISRESLGEYLAEPSVLAVGGSWLTPAILLRDHRFTEIERRARDALQGRP